MTQDDAFLRAIADKPNDDSLRLIYADWLEEHGGQQRAELIRVCEAMRKVPVFSHEYWRLKARRNELRPVCPSDWLAATGYDGSRYDPIYRDGIPPDWRGRWRLIREFTERWHGIPMGDVGGRREEVRAAEERLGRKLPPSLREYIAYAHDVASPEPPGVLFRDVYTLQPMEEHQALSVMMIAEGNVRWAIRYDHLRRRDPPVYTYHWPEDDYTRYVPAEGRGPEARTLSDFVLGYVDAYKSNGGSFRAEVADAQVLREQLEAAFPVRMAGSRRASRYEGNNILVSLYPSSYRKGFEVQVYVHERATWEQVPPFLWEYARQSTTSRGGLFLSEQDRRDYRRRWGSSPLSAALGPAPPPLQDIPPDQPPEPPVAPPDGPPSSGAAEDDIPF